MAVGAAAAWLALVIGLRAHTPLTVGVAGTAAALVGTVALGAARRRPSPAAAASLMSFCVALVLLPLAARVAHARASPLFMLAHEHAEVSATASVTADPRMLAATGSAGAPRVAVETNADTVSAAGRTVGAGGTILVLADARGWHDVLPGQRVRIAGSLQTDIRGSIFSVTLFERGPPLLLGRPPWWQRAAGAVRAALRSASAGLPDQERGLLPGLVDGDTSALDPVLAERFRMAGLTHLVAVSGTKA